MAKTKYLPKERTVKQIIHEGKTVWYGKGGEVKYIVTEEGKYIFPEKKKKEKESPVPSESLDLKGTKVVKEEKAVEDPLKSLEEFHKLHPDLPKVDILFEKEKSLSKIEGGKPKTSTRPKPKKESKGAWDYETEREIQAGYGEYPITKPAEETP